MFSLLNALTLSPALCSLLIKKIKPKKSGFWFKVNNAIASMIHFYSFIVSFIAKKLKVVTAVLVLLFSLVAILFSSAQTSFIPDEDQGVLVMSMQLPEGASKARTEKLIEKAGEIIRREQGVANISDVVGFSLMGGRGENVAMSFIVLKPWEERSDNESFSTNIMHRLQAQMRQFSEAQFQFFEMPAIPWLGTASGLDIRLQSRQNMDYQKLDAALQ